MEGLEPTCGDFRARCLALGKELQARVFREYSRGWYKGYIIVPVGMWGKRLKRVNLSVKNPLL